MIITIPLEKALESLKVALNKVSGLPLDHEFYEISRDAVIQRFEYTFELSWKLLKRYLQESSPENVDGLSANDLFRVGFEMGLLDDAKRWLEYRLARNLTSHTYDEGRANQVFESAKIFVKDGEFFLEELKRRLKK